MSSDTKQEPRESALTAPEDRNPDKGYLTQLQKDQNKPPLNDAEASAAIDELNDTTFVDKFPRVERRFADSPVELQRIGLISFVPAKGATPNANGVFGWAKLRGNYMSDTEASARAASIIRNEDSYHRIQHCYVGRPFPCTESAKYAAETEEVDLTKQTKESMSASVKTKRKDEQKQIDEIHEQEEELKRDVENDDPMERYTTLRVKKAQVTWAYLEHEKKMEEMKAIIIKSREEIAEMEAENDEYKNSYLSRYRTAREKAGIRMSPEEENANFMKFMVEDAELPF